MAKAYHPNSPEQKIWTVGHSTHTAEHFEQILKSHSIEALVDVRAFPGSRRYPQFNKDVLTESLNQIPIAYHHFPNLGGRRRVKPDSKNTAWQNASFRAYADYMETSEFRQGIKSLLELSHDHKVAIMCAEAVWWRCHRSLIADYLKAAGVKVIHIINEQKTEEHPFTSAASIVEGKLSYRGLFDGE